MDSSFESWYVKTNEIITAVNQVNIVDVQAATNAGLEETFRGGGVVYLGVNAGSGVTFGTDGSLTLDASNGLLQSRPNNSDRFAIVINPTTTPEVRVVNASDVLPSQINNDITFTGNVSFSGDLSFITTGSVSLEANTQFEDKQLELAAKFRDVLTFATTASVTIGTTGYFYDKDTIGSTIASGSVSAVDIGNDEISLSDVIFTTAGDAWTSYTDAGATLGGEYLLKALDGTTIGRGLISRTQELEPRADQTAPIDATDAGLIIITNDPTTPAGGSAGHKKLTWQYNGATVSSAWTSSEHFEVVDGKYLDATLINPTGSQIDITSGSSTATLGFTDFTNTSDYFRIQHDRTDPGRTLVFSGNSNGAGAETILTMVADGTMIAGTTAVALNLNADLLDGANGATVGGVANTIPITQSDGKIDQTFIQGTLIVNEDITYAGHGFSAGSVIRKTVDGGYTLAKADSTENAEALGVVQDVVDTNNFTLAYFGRLGISGFDVTLGYSTTGQNDIKVTPGDVYYLSAITAGMVTKQVPVESGHIIKPIALGISDAELFTTHYIGAEVFEVNDAIFAESLVPVGTIFYFGSNTTNIRSDFLVCDGTMYSSANYPELSDIIKSIFYIPATIASTNTLVLATSDSNERGIESGSLMKVSYPNISGGTSEVTATVSGISATSADTLLVTFSSTPFAGFSANEINKAKCFGDDAGNYFFVPDLRGRTAFGAGDSGPNRDSNLGDVLDGFGTSATVSQGQVSFTPVIRAKATADAFIATGHTHDDLYIRLDGGNSPTGTINFGSQSITGIQKLTFTGSGTSIDTNSGSINTNGGDIDTVGGTINASGGRIANIQPTPGGVNDAISFSYADSRYLVKTVGSGTQSINNIVSFSAEVNHQQHINMSNGATITNVPLPVSNNQAASKAYVDQFNTTVYGDLDYWPAGGIPSGLAVNVSEDGIYVIEIQVSCIGEHAVRINSGSQTTLRRNFESTDGGASGHTWFKFIVNVSGGTFNIDTITNAAGDGSNEGTGTIYQVVYHKISN